MADLYLIYMIFSWDFTWRGIPEFPAQSCLWPKTWPTFHGKKSGEILAARNSRMHAWKCPPSYHICTLYPVACWQDAGVVIRGIVYLPTDIF
jgi:hypothetical protein